MHVPFPSSEIFRSLSVRDELLRGMLSADVIGFHLFEYARHFLTCCRRILGLPHAARRCGRFAIDFQGREVLVAVSHVGVEPPFLLGRFGAAPAIVESAAAWRARFPAQRIVAGIDKYPLKIHSKMSQKKITKRSRIKPFIKVVNYNHIMPTRYSLEVDLKHIVNQEVINRPDARPNARKEVKKALEEKYQTSLKTGKNRWFFNKLRF
jgi:ribosomal protein L14E/L6E/L27E